MSCCGNKRREWLNEVRSSGRQEKIENISKPPITNKPDRVFEYTGSYSLIVNGPSGKSYYFRFKGHKIKVNYDDSFALMAERDLKIVH